MHASEPHAWAITVDAGAKAEPMPAALTQGTRVEVQDLFYATPARLKFLKTDRTEAEAVREVVRRLAMSRPDVAFTLTDGTRTPVRLTAALSRLDRLAQILGRDFAATVTALMHGQAYLTSSRIAAAMGPFPGYEKNKESMLDVISMHRAALDRIKIGRAHV